MLTRRENLLRVLRGEKPNWTPCCLNLWQWHAYHRQQNTLPQEVRETDLLDLYKFMGFDIFSRNIGGGIGAKVNADVQRHDEPGSEGPRHITTVQTPHGALRTIFADQTAAATGYVVEDFVKDFDRDGKAYRWLLEHEDYSWDQAAFAALDQRVGDDGLVLVTMACTPLKKLHADFGLDHSSLFVMEQPEAARECCDLFWSRLWPAITQVAEHPRVHAAILMDNFDTPFYSPALCEQFWTPYVRQAADYFAARGKRLFVHACGKLKYSMETFRQAGVHGLEGMAHPPLGDFSARDAWQMPDYFIYNGGFSAQEQVIKQDHEVREFYAKLFSDLKGFNRFIFGAACQTTITTKWERIKLAVELCREHGGRPDAG